MSNVQQQLLTRIFSFFLSSLTLFSVCNWTVLLYTNQSTPKANPPNAATGVAADDGGAAAASSSSSRPFDSSAHRWNAIPICAHDSLAAGGGSASTPSTPFLDFHADVCRIMPIKSVRTDVLHMEVYVEAAGENK